MHRLNIMILLVSVLVPGFALLPMNAAAQKERQKGIIPFAVNERPMPTGESLEKLVPPTVGTFKREALPAGAKPPTDEDINVTYRSGSDTVFFGFSMPETPADAQEAVKVTREEAIASKVSLRGEQYRVGADPSFFRAGAFMSWTRGRYFFYAKASSTAALESFMRAFHY